MQITANSAVSQKLSGNNCRFGNAATTVVKTVEEITPKIVRSTPSKFFRFKTMAAAIGVGTATATVLFLPLWGIAAGALYGAAGICGAVTHELGVQIGGHLLEASDAAKVTAGVAGVQSSLTGLWAGIASRTALLGRKFQYIVKK